MPDISTRTVKKLPLWAVITTPRKYTLKRIEPFYTLRRIIGECINIVKILRR